MAKHWQEVQCELHADSKGVVWDLALYVPVVGFLILTGLKYWYPHGEDEWIGYLLMFLGFFFLMVGGGRVLRRLLILPSAPVALEIDREQLRLKLKGGDRISLIKNIRFFADHANKSFGLTGMDSKGAKKQFVFHRHQFQGEDYQAVVTALEKYK